MPPPSPFPPAAAADNHAGRPGDADQQPTGPASRRVGHSACKPVLTSWTVTVGRGGRAGHGAPVVGRAVGDPVELPATPGTYTFPAHAHVNWQDCGAEPGLIQETGEHAVLVPASPRRAGASPSRARARTT